MLTHVGNYVAASTDCQDQPDYGADQQRSHSITILLSEFLFKSKRNIVEVEKQGKRFCLFFGGGMWRSLVQRVLQAQNIIITMQNLQIESAPKQQPSEPKISQQTIFLVHGITSPLGWFVILNSLDYFHSIYTRFDVYAYFLLAVLIGYLIAAVSYRKITSKLKVQKIVNLGLIVSTVALLLLLAVALVFSAAPRFGFFLSVILCIVVGLSTNIVQLSYFAMINFVSQKSIARFTIGTAFSGVSLTILRMIITAIAGVTPHFGPIFIYFLIGCACQIIDLFLNNIFCNSSYFKEHIDPFMSKQDNRKALNMDQTYQPPLAEVKEVGFLKQLFETNRKIFPYPLIIFSNYVITMMLFPDLTVKISFGFSKVWSSLIFILLFGLGDTVGKIIVTFQGTFNKKSNHYLIIAKLFFFLLIPVMASGKVTSDPLVNNPVFPFIVLFLFGLATGLILSSSILLVSQKTLPADKQLSGVLCGISLQLGLTVGTIFAVPMQLLAPKQAAL